MDLNDALDDLCTRFLVNLPATQLASVEAVGTEIEFAHWFYEDHHRKANPHLPRLRLGHFFECILPRCPTLRHLAPKARELATAYNSYKQTIPTYGAALLSPDRTKVLLVTGHSKQWVFPGGKVNLGETEVECAVREVREEVGIDIDGRVHEHLFIDVNDGRDSTKPRRRIFIVTDVSVDTGVITLTMDEITDIQWHYIDNPAAFSHPTYEYVATALHALYNWVQTGRLPTPIPLPSNATARHKPLHAAPAHKDARVIKFQPAQVVVEAAPGGAPVSSASPRAPRTRNVASTGAATRRKQPEPAREPLAPLDPAPPRQTLPPAASTAVNATVDSLLQDISRAQAKLQELLLAPTPALAPPPRLTVSVSGFPAAITVKPLATVVAFPGPGRARTQPSGARPAPRASGPSPQRSPQQPGRRGGDAAPIQPQLVPGVGAAGPRAASVRSGRRVPAQQQ